MRLYIHRSDIALDTACMTRLMAQEGPGWGNTHIALALRHRVEVGGTLIDPRSRLKYST